MLYEVHECRFPWPSDTLDGSVVVLTKGPVEVLLRWREDDESIEDQMGPEIERLRRGLPGFRRIDLSQRDVPTPGTWMLQHRFDREDGPRFEANVAFRNNTRLFTLKVSGPEEATEACVAVADAVISSVRFKPGEQP